MKLHHFPPVNRARIERVRASKIGLFFCLGRLEVSGQRAAGGLRAFDEKVGLPKFAHY